MSKKIIKSLIERNLYDEILKGKIGYNLVQLESMIQKFVPLACTPFINKFSFRLVENWRSVAIPLKNDFFLILKGTEVESKDIFKTYQNIMDKYFELGIGSNSDHFYLKEGKLPMMVSFKEAELEYKISQGIFQDYFTSFKQLPALPIPIATFRYNQATLPKSFKILKRQMEFTYSIDMDDYEIGGLAYIFKGHPARIKHWKQYCENTKLDRASWLKDQSRYFNNEDTIKRYIALFSQLTAIG
jgi:hypothetical protein